MATNHTDTLKLDDLGRGSRPRILRKFILNLLLIFPATLLLLILIVTSTSSGDKEPKPSAAHVSPSYHPDQQFNDYWYANKAELDRYELHQARYGEMRKGEAVLIFVTEHLDPVTHVKDFNEDLKDIPVMKLNHARKFYTGIYPYSTMVSVFTPVDLKNNPNTLRATFSAQEWCGHVWSMLDLKGTQYKGQVNSYFPDEADFGVTIDNVLLEDEVFNRIRIDPSSLPEGEISILPPQLHLRLLHKEHRIYHADAKKLPAPGPKGEERSAYEITYTDIDRKVRIVYESDFPRKIVSWQETYRDGFTERAHELTTTATLTNSIMLDYWTHNSEADSIYRSQLGITEH